MQRYSNQVRVNSGTPPPVVDLGAPVSAPTITVFIAGTLTLAVLFSDNLATPTPLANPFLGTSTVPGPGGLFFFYADDGRYDVQVSLGTPAIPAPYILAGDVLLNLFALSVNAVEDCGADPTGLTDTTVAAQCAIDLGETEGRAVRFPAGTYSLTAPLVPHDDLVLFGDGQELTIFKPLNAGYAAAFIEYLSGATDISGAEFHDFWINGDHVLGGDVNSSGTFGIHLQRAERCRIHDVQIRRIDGPGIRTTNPGLGRSCYFRGNHIRNVAGHGMHIGSTDPVIGPNNIIADPEGDGIFADAVPGAQIFNNHIGRSGVGTVAGTQADIHVNSVGALITGNICEAGLSKGIFYDATGQTAVGVITGNRIHTKTGAGQWAIHVRGNRIALLGNRMSNTDDAVFYQDGVLGSYIGNSVNGSPGVVTLAAGTVPPELNLGNVVDLSTKNGYPFRRIWLPAEAFTLQSGTPVNAIRGANARYAAWSLLNGADEGVASIDALPLDNDTGSAAVIVKVHWTNLGAGAGNTVWRVRARALGTANLDLNATAGEVTATDTFAAGAQNVLVISTSTIAFTPTLAEFLMRFTVERLGLNGSDTLGNPAGFVGLEIQYVPGM